MEMRKVIICLMAMAALAASGVLGQSAEEGQLDAAALFEQKCSICHSTNRAKSKHKTASKWATTVERMRKKGAPLTDEEAKVVIDYLAQNYGK
jgi:mono/diheme cytochrome c family protein